jgi:hypothetical protein
MLAATSLLAIGFTWPQLLVFIVPLLCVAGLSRMGFGCAAPVFAVAAGCILLGPVFSQFYWRYPFVPPSPLAEFRNIKVIEQLSYVYGLDSGANLHPVVTAESSIPQVQFSWLETSDRVLQPWRARNLKAQSNQPLSVELVNAIWHAANRDGLLINGEPGYPDTKTLSGYVAVVQLNDQSKAVVASLIGDQHSNDHYPYYELAMTLNVDEPKLMASQRFFVDFAGIEGMNWLAFSVMSFMVMLPVVIVLEVVWAIWRRSRPNSELPLLRAALRQRITAHVDGPSRTQP